MTLPTTAETLRLPDGRHLDIAGSGPDDGRVLLFHHGTPGARTQDRVLARAAHAHGLRLVTCSRAGYGGSSRKAARVVADVADDVRAVLDHLGVERCLTAGWSGGGPHALATAALLPERVDAALVIAGVAPYDADGLDFLAGMGEDNVAEFGAAVEGEDALRTFLEAVAPALREAQASDLVGSLSTLLPDIDRRALTDEYGDDVAASFREGLRVGVDGWLDDDLAFTRPWGFDLAHVDRPVSLWQGSADLMVPFAHGRWLAAHLPGAAVHLLDGEGHLSVGLGRIDDMLAELVALGR